jgi:hypothetical protein
VALDAWAVITVADLKDELDSPPASSRLDARLEFVANRVTAICEAHCRRNFLPHVALPLVEFHSPSAEYQPLYLVDWPLAAVVSVQEDPDSVYGAPVILDPATYSVEFGASDGTVRARISPRPGYPWTYSGPRMYRVTTTPLWTTRAQVNASIKDVALSLGALRWREIERKAQGEMQKTDASGAVFKFMDRSLTSAHLSDEMKAQLQPFVAEDYIPTGQRA